MRSAPSPRFSDCPAHSVRNGPHRATAVFGQRLYAGLSVAAAASTVLPGRSADALSQAPAGGPDVVLLPGPAVAPHHRRIALAAVNTRLLALAGRYGTECAGRRCGHRCR